MKKILPLVLLVIGTASNAQTGKNEPPPPPPKPKIVKDEKVKEPPPPPTKKDEVLKYKEVKAVPPKVIIDEKVDASKPEEPTVITVRGKLANDFYKTNPSVDEISRRGNIITLKRKNGTIEKYDISKKEEDKNFTEKYGVSPVPPPPPPPKKIS